MSLKKCAAVAYLVLAASLLAYGNSIVSGDRNLRLKFNADSLLIRGRPAVTSQERVLFRSTLQDLPGRGTGIQNTGWNSSYPAASASEQEGALYVPELGSGVMLSIGLFAIIHLMAVRRTSRSYTGNAV